MRLASMARSILPEPLFYRLVAATYRLRTEQRLLFISELVPRGGTAVDAGAWWGPWTYWLSRRASLVWSFEPNPEMAAFLARNARSNVHVANVGLSSHGGVGTLYVPAGVGRDALATMVPNRRAADARPIEISLRPLDHYSLEDVGFIKIDVEGHEFEALKGAEKTLTRSKPVLLVEVEQVFHEEPIHQLFEWLGDRGYQGHLRRHRAWEPISTFDAARDQSPDTRVKSTKYINNFVFTPQGHPPLAS